MTNAEYAQMVPLPSGMSTSRSKSTSRYKSTDICKHNAHMDRSLGWCGTTRKSCGLSSAGEGAKDLPRKTHRNSFKAPVCLTAVVSGAVSEEN